MKPYQLLLILCCLAYQSQAQNFKEVLNTTASNRESPDAFGLSVDISENIAIIGAKERDAMTKEGMILEDAGAVYIFEKDTVVGWREVQKLKIAYPEEYAGFGTSVSISGDYAIVGAAEASTNEQEEDSLGLAGAAYIFERNKEGKWIEKQKLVAKDRAEGDRFGWRVSMDNDIAIIGAVTEGDFGDGFAELAGAAYIFERDKKGQWIEQQKLIASDRWAYDAFGYAVHVSGDYAVVGAKGESIVEEEVLEMGSRVGEGAAYVFKRGDDGLWVEDQKVMAFNRKQREAFGYSVAISEDFLMVGAVYKNDKSYNAGAVYVFEKDLTGAWKESQILTAPVKNTSDNFGGFVSMSGDYLVVGAKGQDTDASNKKPVTNAGAAYVFKKNDRGKWRLMQKLVAAKRMKYAGLGCTVAIDGTTILAGAAFNHMDAVGQNLLNKAGLVYFFDGE